MRFRALTALAIGQMLNWTTALAQTPPASTLLIDVENQVQYWEDNTDFSTFATNANLTPLKPLKNFGRFITIADIVAVNGQPVKGTFTNRGVMLQIAPSPNPGQAVGDVGQATYNIQTFQILKQDGSAIGAIMVVGAAGTPPPPGAPRALTGNTIAVVGGTGAFLGLRGQSGGSVSVAATGTRQASMTEDPGTRRNFGGGKGRFIVHAIALSVPRFEMTSRGPSLFHADSTPVSAAQPAKPGELLIARVTDLGPAVRAEPGQPFSTELSAAVNSPVGVTVNGQSSEVANAVGWPGEENTYRVEFRVPEATAPGMAVIGLSSAWINGVPVQIPVQ